jgi:hypothetical protein
MEFEWARGVGGIIMSRKVKHLDTKTSAGIAEFPHEFSCEEDLCSHLLRITA